MQKRLRDMTWEDYGISKNRYAELKAFCLQYEEKKEAEVLLVELNKEVIGYVLYFFNYSTFIGRGGFYLEDIYIKEQYRKNGYGKAIFKVLGKIAYENGCKRMEWACLNWNKPSIEFYKSLGAVGMDEWTVYRLTRDKIKSLAES